MLSSIGGLPFRDIAGLGVYSLGLIGMFTASASYHLVRRPSLKEWFRRVDHAVIFVMIAGSYTPFALKIGGETGTLILAAVWGIALLGVAVKMLFPRKLDKISVLSYLAQGWCIVFALDRLVAAVPSSGVDLLVIGGCIYSAGVIFHLLTRLPFHNAIWHLFVLGGASVQYASIYVTVIPQG
jgi:hemolysin III